LRQREWERAAEAYAAALELGAQVFQAAGSDAVRRREVRESWHVHARASYALLRRGQLADALVTLDRGKARLLGERLGLAPETGLDTERILALAPAGGALVMPVVTPAGGAALVFPAGRRTPAPEDVLWLDGLTDLAVVELLGGPTDAPLGAWLGGFMAERGALLGSPGRLAWEEAIATAIGKLWKLVMGAVHERLRRLGLARGAPVAIVPQGGLSLLPLAAAGAFPR